MFTGLIETLGNVARLEPLDATDSGGNGTSLTIDGCASILSDCALGDSIAINGTCLTVTEFTPSSFKVGVAPETLRRTNLGDLRAGDPVNLERAVKGDTRLGGHIVQGHVDTIASISRVTPDGNAIVFRLAPRERGVLRYIVEKGYVALDGASLTVTGVDDREGWFEIMLIAYSQGKVVMTGKTEGMGVNVEIDIVGKIVEKSILGYLEEGSGGGGGGGVPAMLEKLVGRLVEEKIQAMGLRR